MRIHKPFSDAKPLSTVEGLQIIQNALSDTVTGWDQTGNGELDIYFDDGNNITIMHMTENHFLLFIHHDNIAYHPEDLSRGLSLVEGEAGGDPFYMPLSTITNPEETFFLINEYVSNGIDVLLPRLTKQTDVECPEDYPEL